MLKYVVVLGAIFLIVNLQSIVEKIIVDGFSSQSDMGADVSGRRLLGKIEWIRLYPMKKFLLGGMWIFFLYGTVRGVVMSIQTQRTDFWWITAFFCVLTVCTARKIWRYIRISCRCAPVLNEMMSKEELCHSLEGEAFKRVSFQDKLMQKYVHVLISEKYAVIDGTLISRGEVKCADFEEAVYPRRKAQILVIYQNGRRLALRDNSLYASGERAKEMKAVLQQITGVDNTEIMKQEYRGFGAESEKKDKSFIYWKMNYRGKFRRTLWMIPIVVVLCAVTPLFMGVWWPLYDLILIVVMISQLVYTYRRMKEEEKQESDSSK